MVLGLLLSIPAVNSIRSDPQLDSLLSDDDFIALSQRNEGVRKLLKDTSNASIQRFLVDHPSLFDKQHDREEQEKMTESLRTKWQSESLESAVPDHQISPLASFSYSIPLFDNELIPLDITPITSSCESVMHAYSAFPMLFESRGGSRESSTEGRQAGNEMGVLMSQFSRMASSIPSKLRGPMLAAMKGYMPKLADHHSWRSDISKLLSSPPEEWTRNGIASSGAAQGEPDWSPGSALLRRVEALYHGYIGSLSLIDDEDPWWQEMDREEDGGLGNLCAFSVDSLNGVNIEECVSTWEAVKEYLQACKRKEDHFRGGSSDTCPISTGASSSNTKVQVESSCDRLLRTASSSDPISADSCSSQMTNALWLCSPSMKERLPTNLCTQQLLELLSCSYKIEYTPPVPADRALMDLSELVKAKGISLDRDAVCEIVIQPAIHSILHPQDYESGDSDRSSLKKSMNQASNACGGSADHPSLIEYHRDRIQRMRSIANSNQLDRDNQIESMNRLRRLARSPMASIVKLETKSHESLKRLQSILNRFSSEMMKAGLHATSRSARHSNVGVRTDVYRQGVEPLLEWSARLQSAIEDPNNRDASESLGLPSGTLSARSCQTRTHG
eukprot:GHVH01003217.1.p1 GENE.GHVH01003217.1~~GHVH01003217.1.p1  ORF type:complete len:616 (+),score=105.01 GHVH01003217.1:1961-3808(+)